MNKLPNGDSAIGMPGSEARLNQEKEIAHHEAEMRLDLPPNHDYGKDSIAAKYVDAFVEGAVWAKNFGTFKN